MGLSKGRVNKLQAAMELARERKKLIEPRSAGENKEEWVKDAVV